MAYPAPYSVGTAATLTFLLAAETGIIPTSFSRKTATKTLDIVDGSVGYTTGFFEYDINAMYDVKGYITTANSGVAVAVAGTTVSLADVTSGNGVTAGGIYAKTTSYDHTGEQAAEFTLTARQLPGIN
jgi:hypothetical protein